MNTELFLFADFVLAATILQEAIKTGVAYILLTAESGAGKSSLLNYLKQLLDAHLYRIVYFQDQKLNLTGLIRVLAMKLRIPIRRTNAETVQDMVSVLSEDPGHTLIWCDEAHLVPDETLSAIRSLVEARLGSKSKISVILCGLPVLRNNLQAPHLFPIWRRLQRRVEIIGLTADEAGPFLSHLLGKKNAQRFKSDAVCALFEHSRGLPGLFVNYLDVIIRQAPKGNIDQETVQNVIQQWDLA